MSRRPSAAWRDSKMVRSRVITALLLSAITCCIAPHAATAAPAKKQSDLLAATWKAVLEAPDAENPFGTGGQAFACIDLGRTVAPLAPTGVDSCTLTPGTALLVIGTSFE